MTMRIVIQNTDTSRTAKAQVRGIKYDEATRAYTGERTVAQPAIEIAPQTEKEVWLHSGQDCVLSEV